MIHNFIRLYLCTENFHKVSRCPETSRLVPRSISDHESDDTDLEAGESVGPGQVQVSLISHIDSRRVLRSQIPT